jgi:hypothetical protein
MGRTNSIANLDNQRYHYYPLDAGRDITLLPDEHEVVVNTLSGLTLLIDWERRRVKAECQFDDLELPLIRLLLDDWPSYTPYEKLFPLLFSETVAQQMRACLVDAVERNDKAMLNEILGPLRTVLHRCQDRLGLLDLRIAALYQHGYRLVRASSLGQPHEQEGGQPDDRHL